MARVLPQGASGISGGAVGVSPVVPEFLLDLLLPKTDRAVGIQWMIMVPLWLLAIALTRNMQKETRLFVYGLAMLNLAWFAARTIH